jgi:hypothetical protein
MGNPLSVMKQIASYTGFYLFFHRDAMPALEFVNSLSGVTEPRVIRPRQKLAHSDDKVFFDRNDRSIPGHLSTHVKFVTI